MGNDIFNSSMLSHYLNMYINEIYIFYYNEKEIKECTLNKTSRRCKYPTVCTSLKSRINYNIHSKSDESYITVNFILLCYDKNIIH